MSSASNQIEGDEELFGAGSGGRWSGPCMPDVSAFLAYWL